MQLSYCQIFFVTYSMVLMSILYTLLLLTSLTLILFLKFSIVLPYTAFFINLYNAFPSLPPFFSASILFCVLNLIYGFNHCDWLSADKRRTFWFLIPVSNKVASFHNEEHTFSIKKVRHQFFDITNRNIINMSNH